GSPLEADRDLYTRLARETGRRTLVERFVVPRRSGRAWSVRAGQLFRIVAVEGPQVADLNVWSLGNPRERFWAARTRQLHRSHLRRPLLGQAEPSDGGRLHRVLCGNRRPLRHLGVPPRRPLGAGVGARRGRSPRDLPPARRGDLGAGAGGARRLGPAAALGLPGGPRINVEGSGDGGPVKPELVAIPARPGKAAPVTDGQRPRVVNTHGTQVVDAWAFNARDVTEWMSMEASRAWF